MIKEKGQLTSRLTAIQSKVASIHPRWMVQSDADMVDNECWPANFCTNLFEISHHLCHHLYQQVYHHQESHQGAQSSYCVVIWQPRFFTGKLHDNYDWESGLLRMNCWKWVFALEIAAREDSQNPLVWMMLIYLGHIECMFINWLQGSYSMANSVSMISLFYFPEIGQLQGDTVHILFCNANGYCTPVNGPYK